MRETRLLLPEVGLIAGTRAALGAGVGLLLADKMDRERRQAVGWTLVVVGIVSTLPLVGIVLCRSECRRRKAFGKWFRK